MKNTKKFTFAVESELAVVDRNPEYADLDNPNGDIIRERYFMTATDADGRIYRYGWEETAEKAEMVFQYLAPAVEEWPMWRCVYGSRAYDLEGCETDWAIREMEEDLGPNWRAHAPERSLILGF